MIELRDYQVETLEAIPTYFESNDGNPLCVLPTGAGKSIIIGRFCRNVVGTWPDQRMMMVTHVKELIEQNYDKLIAQWPEAPAGIYSASFNSRDTHQNIIFGGIQSIYKRAFEFGKIDLLLVDEAHLIPSKNQGMYRKFIDDLLIANPKLKVIGFTATHYRMDTGLLTDGDDRIFTDVCYELPMGRLLRDGHLCPLRTPKAGATIDLSDVRTVSKDYSKKDQDREVRKITQDALTEICAHGSTRRSWLIFCPTVEYAMDIAELLRARGITAECVTGDPKLTPKVERERILREYKAGRIKCVVNCDVLTTGFDAPATDLLVFLRSTKSTALYVQMCLDTETEILTRQGWRNIDTIQDSDIAITMDIDSGLGATSEIKEIIRRPAHEGEKFVSISSPRLDIRVTDKHTMIFSARKFNGGFSDWRKIDADQLAEKRDGFRIPAAVSLESPGVDLTDDELRFIGLFLSDGTLNKINNAVTIYQSERYPEAIDFIKGALEGCGFKYGDSVISGDICFGKPRANDMHRFTVSKGQPRGRDKHLQGWGRLERFIDKDFPLELMDCTDEQFRVLLHAIHVGDGSKSEGVRGYSISTGNKVYADRLQAACITHGLPANVATETGSRSSPLYLIHVTLKHSARRVGGANQKDRPSLQTEAAPSDEMVWCIRTEQGSIITRRNGKVAIMGNCGRGMRISPDTGKTECLLLDFGGNVERFGPVDAIEVKSKRKGAKAEVTGAPTKVCDDCKNIINIFLRTCPHCGKEFPWEPVSHQANASNAAVLSEHIEPERLAVSRVSYSRHTKPGKPPSMKVTYQCGLATFVSEWVCFEHRGMAQTKAVMWWRARTVRMTPATVDDALEIAKAGELMEPATITVKKTGKFTEVIGYELERSGSEEDSGSGAGIVGAARAGA